MFIQNMCNLAVLFVHYEHSIYNITNELHFTPSPGNTKMSKI